MECGLRMQVLPSDNGSRSKERIHGNERKNLMDELIQILSDVKDDVDFANCTTLIDDGILNSFDILQIISELNDAYDISIPASEIVPANFNSAKALYEMVKRLQDA